SNCTLSDNVAGGVAFGGGIYNSGTESEGSAMLTINSSTLSGNSATYGGGILNEGFSGSAMLTINNSKFSGNFAYNGGGGIASWSVGSQAAAATLTINNSTLSGNSAYYGDSIYNDGTAVLTIGNTILKVAASGTNIYNGYGTVTSLGYNLSSDWGGGLLAAMGDQINTDPMLGPLQDNGGPTFTHALLTGSPAIDAGKNFTAATMDERGPGFVRTSDNPSVGNANGGDGTDIGAYEV